MAKFDQRDSFYKFDSPRRPTTCRPVLMLLAWLPFATAALSNSELTARIMSFAGGYREPRLVFEVKEGFGYRRFSQSAGYRNLGE